MPSITTLAEYGAAVLEGLGILVIVVVALYATVHASLQWARGRGDAQLYTRYRHRLARGILLGLELLVGADIIRTVVIELTFRRVGVLAVIVLIRTFLSFSLEVELTGRLPWQGPVEGKGTRSPNGS